jgi:oligo-1,6-glucosidase
MNQKCFAPHNAFSVGETTVIGKEIGKLITADYRNEMNLFFNFDLLETPGHNRFDNYEYDLNYLKKYFIYYQSDLGSNRYWWSIFFENHDNPRMISKISNNPLYRQKIGKLLGLIQFTLKGTPFIYQGQELGSINKKFNSIDQLNDVESINRYNELIKNTKDKKAVLESTIHGSRDHGRAPMQWDDTANGGFSGVNKNVKPWILQDDDYKENNVSIESIDNDSVLNFYKKIIEIRKDNISELVYGDVKFEYKYKKNIFIYKRISKNKEFVIEVNLSNKKVRKPHIYNSQYGLILSNYKAEEQDKFYLNSYEANLYIRILGDKK